MDDLPIAQAKDELRRCLEEHGFVLVVGDTGSGKTTQVPRYLLEWGLTPVAITQPRRVAATSVSARVASLVNIEHIVGYKVRFESRLDAKSQLIFMTDGVLLRECISDPFLRKYKTIMLDEAHERSVETDVLFGLIKKAVARRAGGLRCLISSATLDVERFQTYFNFCPIVRVEGRAFPVDIYHSKSIQTMTKSGPLSREYVDNCVQVAAQIHQSQDEGHILCFLTGQDEIERACRSLRQELQDSKDDFSVLPLYGALSFDQAAQVFAEETITTSSLTSSSSSTTKRHKRKIVFATNVAETSITVPGVRYVIDAGYAKIKGYEPRRNIASLSIVPISKVAAEQRAGRAGRTAPGQCYRLYSKACFEAMTPDTMPAIKRTSMASVVLILKSLKIAHVLNFDFLDPPDPNQLACALIELHALGALDPDCKNQAGLTPIGKAMASLPLEPHLSRALLHPEKNNLKKTRKPCPVMSSLLSICACLSSEDIWITPPASKSNKDASSHLTETDLAAEAHLAFSHERGDLFSLVNVYNAFSRLPQAKQASWCKRYYLRLRALRFAQKAYDQLESELNYIDDTSLKHLDPESSLPHDDLITRALCFGLCLNAAERGLHAESFVLLPGAGSKLDSQREADLLDDPQLAALLDKADRPPAVGLVRIEESTAAAFRCTPDAIVFHELRIGSSSRGAFARNLVVVSPSLLSAARARLEQNVSLAALCGIQTKILASATDTPAPSLSPSSDSRKKRNNTHMNPPSVQDQKLHQPATTSDLDAARQRFLDRKKKKIIM